MSVASKGFLVITDTIKYLYQIGKILLNIASIRYPLEENLPALVVD